MSTGFFSGPGPSLEAIGSGYRTERVFFVYFIPRHQIGMFLGESLIVTGHAIYIAAINRCHNPSIMLKSPKLLCLCLGQAIGSREIRG